MQSAYRQNNSTSLLKVHSDILSAVDNGCVVVLVLLDITAAFDTIDHAIMLSRLRHRFGVTGTTLDWLRSYLVNRKQLVRIGSDNSSPTSVPFGVHQGYVLCPLLFTEYITPLGDLIRKYGLEWWPFRLPPIRRWYANLYFLSPWWRWTIRRTKLSAQVSRGESEMVAVKFT